MKSVGEKKEFHTYIRGIILLGFSMLLFKLIVTGDIELFIAPKMMKFIYFAFFVSFILGCLQVWNSGKKEQYGCYCCHDHALPKTGFGSVLFYMLFLTPIVSAFLFSNVTIDGSVAAKRGINQSGQVEEAAEHNIDAPLSAYAVEAVQKLEADLLKEDHIKIEDTNYMATIDIIGRDVLGFKGKEVTFIGFVYRDKEVKDNKVIVARYGMACCVADASVFGMVVSGDGVEKLPEESWVQVTGVLHETTYKGALFPLVKAKKIEQIETPKQPYVYQ